MNEKLNEYNFEIKHIPGKENKVADALSRIPIQKQKESDQSSKVKMISANNPFNNEIDLHKFNVSDMEDDVEREIFMFKNIKQNKKKNPCRLCKFQGNSLEEHYADLNAHKEYFNKTSYQCVICLKYLSGTKQLEYHMRTHKRNAIEIPDQKELVNEIRKYRDKTIITTTQINLPNTEEIDDIDDDMGTIHSASEDNINYLFISEKPINIFKNQILVNNGNLPDIITKIHNKNRHIIYLSNNDDEGIERIIKIINPKIKYGILFENNDTYLKLQQYINKHNHKNKVEKVNKILIDLTEDNFIEKILYYHSKKFNHPGIEKTFDEMYKKYYYPNLKREITRQVNNCKVCNISKIERQPVKMPFQKTFTPTEPQQIYHLDVWYFNANEFYLTCIDKFSKYASIEKLDSRTWADIMNAYIKIFNYMGKPKKIVIDNETGLYAARTKEFMQQESIEVHLTSSNHHRGNSDIERFHFTLKEHIILLNNSQKIREKDYYPNPVIDGVFRYNNIIHSTIKERPIDVHFRRNTDKFPEIYKRIEKYKESLVKGKNDKRKDRETNPNIMINTMAKTKLDNPYVVSQAIPLDPLHYVENKRAKCKTIKPYKYHKEAFKRLKKFEKILPSRSPIRRDFNPMPSTSTNANN